MMQIVLSWRCGQAAVVPVLWAVLLALLWPSSGSAQSLFAQHQVTVDFATGDGKPLADAEVRVFAPGQTGRPTLTGRTDSAGKFEFSADRDGFWSAEARSGDQIARVMIRVGDKEGNQEPPSPIWLIGGLVLLLILAFALRIARARVLRRQAKRAAPPPPIP
jgi:hypothetical protein